MTVRSIILLLAAVLMSGCGAFRSQEAASPEGSFAGASGPPSGAGIALHANISQPSVPEDLKAQARATERSSAEDGKKYSYTLEVKSEKRPELAETFEKVSRLALMKDEPASLTTLDQRLAVSLDEGREIMHSQGFYEGQVNGRIKTAGDKAVAEIEFIPGPRYRLGETKVVTVNPLEKKSGAKAPPKSLADVGLKSGEKAIADDILEAVDRVESAFRNRGYPRASITATRFVLNPPKKTLNAEVHVDPGRFARMGEVIRPEDSPVDQKYLDALRTWKVGQPWNQELMDNYLGALRQTGLFQRVEGFPAREDGPDGNRPIRIKLTGAAERTVGGMISYDTDFGPGINGYWEHRNLTGHGDRLRLDMPLWKDMQELTASYRYPYFMRPDQDIIARGGLVHQETDAYELTSGAASAGLERRLSRRWKVSLMGSVEGGSLKDPDQSKKEFIMFGLPATATYDNANSLMDPTKGMRLIMLAAPYTGTFHEDFNVVRTRVEGQAFVPLGSDRLVMAMRGVWGSLWGADNSQDVPSALRFYSGGGGSVRGYDYQSIGPRNDKHDPLGGVSQVEVSAETRWRFSENMGLVAFIDGGMVYENVDDELFQDMLWGAGLGFRYYTPIGPARVDVALPLDRRDGDDAWQLYISLGQSF